MFNKKTTKEDKDTSLRNKYYKSTMLIFLIGIIFFIWIIIEILSIYSFDMDNKWSLLSLTEWMYIGIFFIVFLIILELFLFIRYQSVGKIKAEKKPEAIYYKGKQLLVYTHPTGSKGGIFSKTFIKIDNNNILNLRVQMMSPEELWGKKRK